MSDGEKIDHFPIGEEAFPSGHEVTAEDVEAAVLSLRRDDARRLGWWPPSAAVAVALASFAFGLLIGAWAW